MPLLCIGMYIVYEGMTGFSTFTYDPCAHVVSSLTCIAGHPNTAEQLHDNCKALVYRVPRRKACAHVSVPV